MEEIRLLTNLETFQHKLVQLVLAGQPELDQRLDSPELRQLKQRISFRCQLTPLTFAEMRGYIQSRLEHAGANSDAEAIFPDESIAAIYEFSGGIPRIVNNLCENSLVAGYGKQMPEITAETIREVASDLRLSQVAITSLEDHVETDAEIDIPLVSTGEAMPEPLTQSEPGAEKP
jgi:general secretion pathway protein A